MSGSLGEVNDYLHLYGLIHVKLPVKALVCEYCRECVKDPTYNHRSICRQTKEILFYPEIERSEECPLRQGISSLMEWIEAHKEEFQ